MPLPFALSLPHCSKKVPDQIRPFIRLSDEQILESVDIGTAEIFSSIPATTLIVADWNRLVVDLNRSPDQRDTKGAIALIDYHGRPVYHANKNPDEAETGIRIQEYYMPFHRQLEKAINDPGIKALFDCHSLTAVGPAEAPDAGKRRKDITLSNNGDTAGHPVDRNFITCPGEKLNLIKDFFEQEGFSVSLNDPYKGGYITTHYGRKLSAQNKFAVQIEINQALYTDNSGTFTVADKIIQTRNQIQKVFKRIGNMD